MEQRFSSEQLMIRYLLGDISTEEQLEVETEYFTDPEKFNLLQAIEHDLIEGYINAKLSSADTARFETHYLSSPVRRQQVEFFKTLAQTLPLEAKQSLSAQAAVPLAAIESLELGEKISWWQSLLAFFQGPKLTLGASFAAAVLILMAGAIWQVVETRQLRHQLAQTESARAALKQREEELNQKIDAQREKNDQLAQERESIRQQLEALPAPAPKPMPAMVSFTWTLSGLRNANPTNNVTRRLRIQPGTDVVQLIFDIPATRYNRYSVALQNLSGEKVWSRDEVKATQAESSTSLVVRVPAKQFQRGSYSLVLSGNNDRNEWVEIGEFYIEVDR